MPGIFAFKCEVSIVNVSAKKSGFAQAGHIPKHPNLPYLYRHADFDANG